MENLTATSTLEYASRHERRSCFLRNLVLFVLALAEPAFILVAAGIWGFKDLEGVLVLVFLPCLVLIALMRTSIVIRIVLGVLIVSLYAGALVMLSRAGGWI